MAADPSPLSTDLQQEIEQEDQFRPAIYEFNRKPTRGITLLCQAHGLDESPQSKAHVLHLVPGLLSSQIGEYLSRIDNREVLQAYFLEMDFHMSFLDGLRKALTARLQLPAEGEQIDRILDVWAHCWAQQNPEDIDGDRAYVLAFAAVLLNSDLHNPAVPRKMSVRDFIENVRGAIPAEALSDSKLTEVYHSIRTDPIQFRRADDLFAMASPKLRGRLERRGGLFQRWTVYYFVLTDGCLYYFPNETTDEPLGNIQLVSVSIVPTGDRQLSISSADGFLQLIKFVRRKPVIVRGVESVLLRAPNSKLRDKWLYRMRTSSIYAGFGGEEPESTSSEPPETPEPALPLPPPPPPPPAESGGPLKREASQLITHAVSQAISRPRGRTLRGLDAQTWRTPSLADIGRIPQAAVAEGD
jgi:hypothetical protein